MELENHYQVYLLRLWRERPASPNHPAEWRFVLENPNTRQKRGFDSLEGALVFLRAQIDAEQQGEVEGGEA